MTSDYRMVNELERIWKEAVVASFQTGTQGHEKSSDSAAVFHVETSTCYLLHMKQEFQPPGSDVDSSSCFSHGTNIATDIMYIFRYLLINI
jgi:hypothetical protein